MESPHVQRALISVSDKTGLVDFARALAGAGVALYSTGGTARTLQEAGVAVHEVSAYTGFPEMMDGRLKTLHPKVFGGILCRRDHEEDLQALQQHGILSFELVVVNLYPFQATVSRPGVTMAEAIEQIDIGGPSLVRAAAKNHAFVAIVTNPEQYSTVLQEISEVRAAAGQEDIALPTEEVAHAGVSIRSGLLSIPAVGAGARTSRSASAEPACASDPASNRAQAEAPPRSSKRRSRYPMTAKGTAINPIP